MEVRLVHSEKAWFSMVVTELGITVFLHPTINLFVFVSMIALQLLRESYIGFPFSTLMEVKPLQPMKAVETIFVTVLGIISEVRPVQKEKEELPMLVTELGMVMEVRPLQPEKAELPMEVT